MLLREIKNIFHLELDELYPKEEVDSFFFILIEHYLHLERFVLAMQPDHIISKEDEQPLFAALSELKLNHPVQYIIGKTTFMDLDIYVDESVLIPRLETEELVRWILDECHTESFDSAQDKLRRSAELKILDIGTGSGCIAISLAKNLPDAKVFALDVSAEALQIAKKNAQLNDTEITFLEKDILKKVDLEDKFDIIVSNPPYVRELEKKEIAKNVLDYEPETALFVPNENPLLFYQQIAEIAKINLKMSGQLYFEINQYLGKEMIALLKEHNFKDIELRKDLFGNDRMLKGKFPS